MIQAINVKLLKSLLMLMQYTTEQIKSGIASKSHKIIENMKKQCDFV